MQCAWIVPFFFFGFSLQVDLLLAGGLSDCSDYEYKLNGDKQCRDCPACPAGQMYSKHCGYAEANGRITKPNKGCIDCPSDTYKSEKSIYQCESCRYNKCPEGREMIHKCNATHDIKCSKCKKGCYTASDGKCLRCSFCCGKPTEYVTYVQKECEMAGMGHCSCRPLQGCVGQCKIPKDSTENRSIKIPLRSTRASRISSTNIMKRTSTTTWTTTSPTKMTHKKTSELVPQKYERKEKEQDFVSGWLVAIVIGIVLVATIVFHILKRFNIIKKIKFLLRPHGEDIEQVTSKEYEDNAIKNSVITVEEQFISPARPLITNYAQRIPPEEEEQNQSDHIQQRFSFLNRTAGCSISDIEEHNEYDPWVYRGFNQQWPPTRAQMAVNPECGEYIEILESEDPDGDCLSTQGNNSESSLQLHEPTDKDKMTNEPSKTENNENEKGDMRVNIENKTGEEHSDNEEPPTSTSIPATASGENTVVIATGQHRGLMSDESARNDFSKGTRDKISSSGKRKKKQPENKKSRRKPLHEDSSESHDILRCTCGDCSYRPYVREQNLCHCTDCVPQPKDDLYNIIERRCLRAEICKELNKEGVSNWRDLCTYIRIDKDISSIEKEENPAKIVLDKLKSSRPRLKLEDFNIILKKIKRHDIMEIIMRHHIKCMLCRRNSFDGSIVDIHGAPDPNTWIEFKYTS